MKQAHGWFERHRRERPPKRWTDVLCHQCGGNGVIKIHHGVSTCPRCSGRCYEPDIEPAGGDGRAPSAPPNEQIVAMGHLELPTRMMHELYEKAHPASAPEALPPLETMLRDLRESGANRGGPCGVHDQALWTCGFCLHNLLADVATRDRARDAREEKLKAERDYLYDLPLCRQQFPDGGVPGNTEEALSGWKHRAEAALAREAVWRQQLDKRDQEIARLKEPSGGDGRAPSALHEPIHDSTGKFCSQCGARQTDRTAHPASATEALLPLTGYRAGSSICPELDAQKSQRELLIAKLSDTMDPDNAREFVDAVIREAKGL